MLTNHITVELLIKAASQGREIVRHYASNVRSKSLVKKNNGSLLTEADLESQRAISNFLSQKLPGIPILSEETTDFQTNIGTGHWLVIDPLDGTTNFSRDIPFYSVTVAYVVDGIPRIGVVMPAAWDHCYVAVKDEFAALVDDDFNRIPIKRKR